MESYLSSLPTELHQIIFLYLNHIDIIKLRSLYKIKVNFQYLVSVKYPGFYEIFKTVKEKAPDYYDFSYEKGHNLIYKFICCYIENKDRPFVRNLSFSNIDDISEILYDLPNTSELSDILVAYELINPLDYLKSRTNRFYKYRIELPDIIGINGILQYSFDELWEESEPEMILTLVTQLNSESFNTDKRKLNLVSLYLMLLENPEYCEVVHYDLKMCEDDDMDLNILLNHFNKYLKKIISK